MKLEKFYHLYDAKLFITPCIYIRIDNPIYMQRNLFIGIELFWFRIGWLFFEKARKQE